MTDRVHFVVYRDKWIRGGNFESCLLDTDTGCRCCLGHLARDVGIGDNEIKHAVMPYEAPSDLWPASLVPHYQDCLAWDAANTNDNTEIDDAERERRLTERFARDGIEVEFRDGPGPAEDVAP